jgi:hypothetical protein
MSHELTVKQVIQNYLAAVEANLREASPQERATLLREVRAHIDVALASEASDREPSVQDAYAVLASLDPPSAYQQQLVAAGSVPRRDLKLDALAVICALLQIVGLILVIVGVPVVAAVAGFAAVVSFFLSWSRGDAPPWRLRLFGVAAVCGLGLIVLEVARAVG